MLETTTASTSSTRPATSTSPSRSSGRCACSTAPSRCSTASPASSPRPRRCGARPTSTTCPRMCFINKMDRMGADFFKALDSHQGPPRLPPSRWCSCPSAPRATTRASSTWSTCRRWSGRTRSSGAKWDVVRDPRRPGRAQAEEYRQQLIDVLSNFDETILEKFVGEEEITADDLRSALRKADHRQRASCRSSTAPPSRTRACSRCSTPSSTTCPRRSTCRRPRA